MLSEDLKKLLEISGGKIIVSEGNLKKSYVVMKLDEYLKEIEKGKSMKSEKAEGESGKELTEDNVLDKIETEIEEHRKKKIEDELDQVFRKEREEFDYDYI